MKRRNLVLALSAAGTTFSHQPEQAGGGARALLVADYLIQRVRAS